MEKGTRRSGGTVPRATQGPGGAGALVALLSGLKMLDEKACFRELMNATGGLRFSTLVVATIVPTRSPGFLAFPRAVYLAGDGRALAWFGDGRLCIVHPTLEELCRLHGVEAQTTLAA